jgi:hypothetical protein
LTTYLIILVVQKIDQTHFLLKRVKDVLLQEQESLAALSSNHSKKVSGVKKKPQANQLMLSMALAPERIAEEEIDSQMFEREGDDGCVDHMITPKLNKR